LAKGQKALENWFQLPVSALIEIWLKLFSQVLTTREKEKTINHFFILLDNWTYDTDTCN